MTDTLNGKSKPPRPLQAAVAWFFALFIPLTAVVYLYYGTGDPMPLAARQIVLLLYGFIGLCAVCICILALGRYRVLNEALSFWIAVSFVSTLAMQVVYVFTFPATLTSGPGIISRVPGTPAWIIQVAMVLFSLSLLPATMKRTLFAPEPGEGRWLLQTSMAIVAGITVSALILSFEKKLPPLLDGNARFSPGIYLLDGIAALLMGVGAILSLRRYREHGEPLAGYLALMQSIFFAAFAVFFLSTRRFDLWWYAARLLALAACATLLCGMLSGYVGLYRSEREKSDALRRTIADLKKTEEQLQARAQALSAANEELEAFSYSVTHDLRTQLHIMTAFAYLLSEEFQEKLGSDGRDYLGRVSTSIDRMNVVIESILKLTRISKREMAISEVNISRIAATLLGELQQSEPERNVLAVVQDGMVACADEPLITIALTNLIRNAWKFTSHKDEARIEIGKEANGESGFFYIRDNGAGFESLHAGNLFKPFRRLHQDHEFPGTGIGLAIVERVIRRHGGKVWAEGTPAEGACFYFSLPGEACADGTRPVARNEIVAA